MSKAINSGLSSHAPTRARTRVSTKTSQTSWTEDEDSLLSKIMASGAQITAEVVSQNFPEKTQQQVLDRWNKVLNPELIKGSWTTREDEIITQWVNEHGPRNWSALAQTLPGRLGKQCRERWVNNLSPDLIHQPWTEEEDKLLIEHQQKWGNKWAKIASLLPGRTDNSVKNRWNSSLKRKLQRIANGEAPVNKRGRKPKRASNAPDVAPIIKSKSEIIVGSITATPQPPIQPIAPPSALPPKQEAKEKQARLAQKMGSANSTPIDEAKIPQILPISQFAAPIGESGQGDIPKPDFNVVDLALPSPAGPQTPLLLSPYMQMSPILMKDSPFFPLWSPSSNADMKNLVLKSPLPFSFENNDPIDPQKVDFKP